MHYHINLEYCSEFSLYDRNIPYYPFIQNIPAEEVNCVVFGSIAHFGPSALFIYLLHWCGSFLFSMPIFFIASSLLALLMILLMEKKFPSITLKTASTQEIFQSLSYVFITAVGLGTLIVVSGWWCLSYALYIPWHNNSWWSIGNAVFLTDLCYYLVHRTLNHSRGSNDITLWYRKIHAPHHASQVLDFSRGNLSSVFDTAVTGFQIPLIFVSFFLGMNLESTLISYGLILLLQSTHHSNHTFNIGWLRYIFVDNHCHKLHHCRRGFNINFAAIFSFWDIIFGTFYEEWNTSPSYLVKYNISLPKIKYY